MLLFYFLGFKIGGLFRSLLKHILTKIKSFINLKCISYVVKFIPPKTNRFPIIVFCVKHDLYINKHTDSRAK